MYGTLLLSHVTDTPITIGVRVTVSGTKCKVGMDFAIQTSKCATESKLIDNRRHPGIKGSNEFTIRPTLK